MRARLPESTKWTAFPIEFVEKIQQVFQKGFKGEADQGEFIVEGRIYTNEIMLRIGYLETGRLRQINFEVSIDYSQEKHDAMEHIYVAVDAIASLMEEYFADEESVELPPTWKAFNFEGKLLYLQTSTVNSKLEEEANRLLGLNEENLVCDPQENDDAFTKAIVDSELAIDRQKEIQREAKPH